MGANEKGHLGQAFSRQAAVLSCVDSSLLFSPIVPVLGKPFHQFARHREFANQTTSMPTIQYCAFITTYNNFSKGMLDPPCRYGYTSVVFLTGHWQPNIFCNENGGGAGVERHSTHKRRKQFRGKRVHNEPRRSRFFRLYFFHPGAFSGEGVGVRSQSG